LSKVILRCTVSETSRFILNSFAESVSVITYYQFPISAVRVIIRPDGCMEGKSGPGPRRRLYSQTGCGAHPGSYPVVARVLSLGVKGQDHDTYKLLPSTAEIEETLSLYFHNQDKAHNVLQCHSTTIIL
jgi:hypothetical protein